MTIWLPFRRTSEKPCNLKISQTWRPEIILRLGKLNTHFFYGSTLIKTRVDFFFRCLFQE